MAELEQEMEQVPTEMKWEGAEALRQYLVPIDSLQDHGKNPNVGDVAAISASREIRTGVQPSCTMAGSSSPGITSESRPKYWSGRTSQRSRITSPATVAQYGNKREVVILLYYPEQYEVGRGPAVPRARTRRPASLLVDR